MDHLKAVVSTIRPGAATLFFAGAAVMLVAFDTEPPSDDVRTLAGMLGFVAMAIGCGLQILRMHRAV